jgi:3'(2'), 5'-bisphosphate nucleotidase
MIPGVPRLAIEAGDKIMEIYDADDFEVKVKSDASPVTEADEAADALISERAARGLSRCRAGDRGAGRQPRANACDLPDRRSAGRHQGIHQAARRFHREHRLGRDGVPTRGVVYAPAKGRLFYTDAEGRSVEETGPFDPGHHRATAPISRQHAGQRAR